MRWYDEENICYLVAHPIQLSKSYFAEEGEDFDPDTDITGLPSNWKELKWYIIKQYPCLWGDDLRVAFNAESKSHYVIHDMVCEPRVLKAYKPTLKENLQAIAAGEDL